MTPQTPGRTERRDPAESAGRTQRTGQTGRTGRRGGDSGTREAILDAARKQFAAHGYGGATIRRIAADAGVDPALVHHFLRYQGTPAAPRRCGCRWFRVS